MLNRVNIEDYLQMSHEDLVGHLDANCQVSGRHFWMFSTNRDEARPCLVAHIDTVCHNTVIAYEVDDILINLNNGPLGGDDRCGVYILDYFREFYPYKFHFLYTDLEEVGGIGATEAVLYLQKNKWNITCFYEFDRQGRDEAVFYTQQPHNLIKKISRFYKIATGSFSDISILSPLLHIPAVNLSCGYYNQHTEQEFVIKGHVLYAIENFKNFGGK